MRMTPRTPPRIARGASAILSRAKGSFSSPPASGRRGSSSTTATSKEGNIQSPAVSFANDENHTQINAAGGGNGDNTTEIRGDAPVHSGTTLENYVLPKSLRMDVVDEYANGGMEVIKVSKVCMLFWVIVVFRRYLVAAVPWPIHLSSPSHLIHLSIANRNNMCKEW